MSRRPIWETIYKRFDPEHPAVVQAWRVDRRLSPAEVIGRSLDMPNAETRVLLTGTVGTGKTTELLRLRDTRDREAKEFVVFLDLEHHFSEVVRDAPALQHISAWEVCFLAGLALIAAARDKLDYEFPADHVKELERAWVGLAKATETPTAPQIDIATLAKSMVATAATVAPLVTPTPAAVGAGIAAAAAAVGAFKWTISLGQSKRALPDQDREVQTLLACVNVLIGMIQQVNRRVLFIIDGLDRIRDIERAKALFVDSQMIAHLACAIVICGPCALCHHSATAAIRGFTRVSVLVNEPVLLQRDPMKHGPGVPFFCELFDKRVSDLGAPDLLPRDLLEELAYRSGGRARDFVTFIRNLAELAWQEDVTTATPTIVRKVLDDRRRQQEMGLHKGHIQMLEAIAGDPDHALLEGPLAQELLSYGTLLPYPNESEWYYPHPLLTMNLLKVKGTTRPALPSS